MTPLVTMHTLGHTFMPAPIHAGGLRYHGMAPLVSKLVHEGIVEAVAYRQNECFAAGVRFAAHRGHHPGARGQPRDPRASRSRSRRPAPPARARTILFNLCGHGHLELGAYEQYLNGELVDFDLPQADLDAAAEVLVGMPSAG